MQKYLLAATAAAAAVAAASPHQHHHAHLHRRWAATTTEIVATATVFEVNGTPISKEDACEGVEDGEYTWKNTGDGWVCSSTTTSSTEAPTSTEASSTSEAWSSPSDGAGGFYQAAPSSGSGWNNGAQGSDADFPDGQLDCSTFPSAYGALPLEYLGMGGWSGIQNVKGSGGLIHDIVTGIAGDNCNQEGGMCSYACGPGLQKSQWPTEQGATGQSVGGLKCSGGKLWLTNPGLSKKLCIPGAGGVQATNNAGGIVSICRTDYPGTESEVVPVGLNPGETQPLTNPDAGSYYQWQGKSTSAQYYLNPIGYGPEQACKWGDASQPLGNFAPINFGVGHKDGKTWLSIFQNAPTTNAQYQGKVEIQGDVSDKCYYANGQYCGATGCNGNGCTVSQSETLLLIQLTHHRSRSTLAQLLSSSHNKVPQKYDK
jgi:SUN family beta-glucosidase